MKEINRIKKYREFKEILNLRKFKRNEIFAVYFRDNEYKHARVGILVTKKNGNAVTRVKIKRQVRSIIDESLDYQNVSKDFVVVISKKYDVMNFKRNSELLTQIINYFKEN